MPIVRLSCRKATNEDLAKVSKRRKTIDGGETPGNDATTEKAPTGATEFFNVLLPNQPRLSVAP